MTDLRKAAEMALEALEAHADIGIKSDRQIQALRQALAQPQQEPVAWADKVGAVIPHSHKLFQPDLLKDYTRPLYTAPVDAVNISEERVDETVKREHEPIGYINGMHGGYMVFTPINPSAVYLNGTALYLAPPKKEWVGLTDADIAKAMHGSVEGSNMLPYQFARAIEQALKEKNT